MAVKERKTSVGSASFKRPYISEARARDPAERTAEANPFLDLKWRKIIASLTPACAAIFAVDIAVTRSGSTIAFGIVLLSLMVILPVLVLTVAIVVLRGRRKVEVTVMGWIGAMLFATIPLRNFLPGSPPIGSWIDYLIVLWVLAGLVGGLVLFVIAWLRRGPA